MEVPRHFLDNDLMLIKRYVPLVLSELIFNINECGFSEREERKKKPVIVPIEEQGTTLHYPVNRQIRHQTLISCISAAGDGYCPCRVSSNPAATRVFEHGVRDGIDLRVEIVSSA
jgi:hypothetical protein